MDQSTKQALYLMVESIQLQLDTLKRMLMIGEVGKDRVVTQGAVPANDFYTNEEEDKEIARFMDVDERETPKFLQDIFREETEAREANGLDASEGVQQR